MPVNAGWTRSRFNERPSPPAPPVIIALQAARLGTDEEVFEALYQAAIDAGALVECGCCDHYHRPDFYGDCRNDDERFPS